MRSGVIVLLEPVIDEDLRLLGRCEPFCIQNLPTQCAVEALVAPVLLGRSRTDADRLNADASKPDFSAPAANSGPLSDRMYSGAPWLRSSG